MCQHRRAGDGNAVAAAQIGDELRQRLDLRLIDRLRSGIERDFPCAEHPRDGHPDRSRIAVERMGGVAACPTDAQIGLGRVIALNRDPRAIDDEMIMLAIDRRDAQRVPCPMDDNPIHDFPMKKARSRRAGVG